MREHIIISFNVGHQDQENSTRGREQHTEPKKQPKNIRKKIEKKKRNGHIQYPHTIDTLRYNPPTIREEEEHMAIEDKVEEITTTQTTIAHNTKNPIGIPQTHHPMGTIDAEEEEHNEDMEHPKHTTPSL